MNSHRLLEGNEIKTIEDFHRINQRSVKFSCLLWQESYWLWDCLTGYIVIPAKVIWRNFELSNLYLGDFAVMVKQIFEDAEIEIEGFKFEFYLGAKSSIIVALSLQDFS